MFSLIFSWLNSLVAGHPHLSLINGISKFIFIEKLTRTFIGVGPTGLLIFSFSYFDIKYVFICIETNYKAVYWKLHIILSALLLDPMPSKQPAAFIDEIQTSFPQ